MASRLLIGLLVLAMLPACRHKNATITAAPPIPIDSTKRWDIAATKQAPARFYAPIALPDSVAKRLEPSYQYAEGKYRCHFEGAGQKQSFQLQAKIWRGKRTEFTVIAAFGIPIATGWATADSVLVHNKLDGSKHKAPLSRISELTGLPPDLLWLEAVLSGRYAIPQGFVPVALSDSTMEARPLPDTALALRYTFAANNTWPKLATLGWPSGTFSVENSAKAGGNAIHASKVLQLDSLGQVQTMLRMEVVSLKLQ
jgi:hypothetical protein